MRYLHYTHIRLKKQMVNAIYQKLTKDFIYVKYIMVKVHKKKEKNVNKNVKFT